MSELHYRNFVDDCGYHDPAHDIAHIERVVANSKKFAIEEGANLEVVTAAAWLHDCVSTKKDSPLRSTASKLAAEKASEYLQSLGKEPTFIAQVYHAIEAHSFSANIKPETIEAKVVQDADRLDALGAIGIARCILVSASLKTTLYSSEDPLCSVREPDDRTYCIDHFYTKLFKIAQTLNTNSARTEARARVAFMEQFLNQLNLEVGDRRLAD